MYFLDTSALAKRYMAEKGSPWIKSLAPLRFIVAAITHAVIYSALARRLRSGTLLSADHAKLIRLFDYDMERRFRIIDVTRNLYQQSGKLAEKHGLRTYDSVQLACGLKANALLLTVGINDFTFLTADKELLAAAEAEGLTTDNPDNH
jgi:uncharacterized protein